MDKKKDLTRWAEEALNSLDGIQKASPGPFFFIRVDARLRKESHAGFWGKMAYFFSMPSVAIASVVFVILLNTAAFFYQKAETSNILAAEQSEQLNADDYNTTVASNSYYDENTELH